MTKNSGYVSTPIAPTVASRQLRYRLAGPRIAVVLLMLLGGVLAGWGVSTSASSTASAGAEGLAQFYTQTLAWSGCAGIFECTTLTVPLDYTNPAGRSIELAAIRTKATDAYWPVPPQSQPHAVHYAGTPPILVVGTIHDPATPYPSAL
jgi:TAP-like protein